jgi:TonB-dependent starch-binding outer membrane protein SusC
LFGEIRFAPWLSFRTNYSVFLNNQANGSWQSSQSTLRRYSTTFAGAAASYNTDNYKSWLVENILNFNKTFADIHTVGATFVQSMEKSVRVASNMSAEKILTDASKWYDLSSNATGSPNGYGTSYVGKQFLSYTGRLNYTLLDRYILTGSVRFDGASVLSVGNKWASFPSVSAAWKIQEESFMSELTWVNELKLRAGYGQAGTANVDPYTSTGPLSVYDYVFGTSPAVSFLPYLMSNPTLTWERAAQSNIALDFGFLNNRIVGSIDLYQTNTTGLLLERILPPIIGYPLILDNIGKTKNQGVEVTVSTRNIVNRDFTWSTDLSFAHNEDEIV